MRCLFPIPPETAANLKREKETGIGYQVVSVQLKDQRSFDQVVVEPALKKALETRSKETGVPISEFVRRALVEALKKSK
jgi:hypothetical protein